MAAVSASSRRTSNAPGSSTAARSPGMLRTSCWRGLKFRTGKGPNPSAEAEDGCRQTIPMRPATSARHVELPRRSSEQSMSVWEIQAGEDGASLFAISIVDSTDHVRSNDASKTNAGGHPIVLEADIFEAVEDLARVQKGCDFKIRRDTGNLGPRKMDAFFNTRRNQVLVDEPIDAISSEVILSTQRTLLEKRHLVAKRGLKVGPDEQNGPFGLAGDQFFDLQLVARKDREIVITDILIDFGIGRHGHAVGRRNKVVPRIVIEGRPVSDNYRFALNPVNRRIDVTCRG